MSLTIMISRIDPEMQHIRRNTWIAFARYCNKPINDIATNVMLRVSARNEWREWLIKTTPYPIEFDTDSNGYTLSIKFVSKEDKTAFLLKWK